MPLQQWVVPLSTIRGAIYQTADAAARDTTLHDRLSLGEGTLPADARRLKELLAGDFFLRPVNPDEASNNIFQVSICLSEYRKV